ncbi:protein LURP-one-related 10-like isoform X2 [Carya illinoinensis]|uniref:Uncharacterized protein n=1 Tax=Carya illinoinensis TaxID=32201 RepID=A0A8T1PF37_CARIL|nr:protein LURP-one-related 10-like isoform X2 [Carya illinoinensis]KAG6640284.1 hypothetical protein CIPAW_10G162600 [Carya illinoinensis]
MAQQIPAPVPTAAQFANPRPVISTEYCAPYSIILAVVKKLMSVGNFDVIDTNSTVIFEVKRKLMTLHDERVLLDDAENPIITLREQRMTAHHRWNVYRGKSKEPNDLIFTVKRSEMIQWTAKLHVFLANNTEEKMSRETTFGNALIGKDNYKVTIRPNVDFAFIVALIVILEDMNHISERDEKAIGIGVAVANIGLTVAGVEPLVS